MKIQIFGGKYCGDEIELQPPKELKERHLGRMLFDAALQKGAIDLILSGRKKTVKDLVWFEAYVYARIKLASLRGRRIVVGNVVLNPESLTCRIEVQSLLDCKIYSFSVCKTGDLYVHMENPVYHTFSQEIDALPHP